MSSNENGEKGSNVKAKSVNKPIIIIGAIVIVALVGVIVYLLWPKQDEKRNVVVTKDNVEEVVEEMANSEPTTPGYYTVTQNSTWYFADGESPSDNAFVENATENTSDVYFDVFIKGEEDNEDNALYKSPVLPVGQSVSNIKLDKDLDAGTYECVIVYHLVDEDQKTFDTVRVGLTISIGS